MTLNAAFPFLLNTRATAILKQIKRLKFRNLKRHHPSLLSFEDMITIFHELPKLFAKGSRAYMSDANV